MSPLATIKNTTGSAVSKNRYFLPVFDTFLQDPGIDSIEYLVSISAPLQIRVSDSDQKSKLNYVCLFVMHLSFVYTTPEGPGKPAGI